MRIRRFSCLAMAIGLAWATAIPAAAQTGGLGPSDTSRGTLFIVGGGTQPPELVRHFVDLAGGAGRARIAILPMASEDAAETGRDKAVELRQLGADAFVVNVTRADAQSDSIVRLLATATGIWFPGGDQARLTGVLGATRALDAIRARYREGAVVGGTSAGAAIMSDTMITGDQFRAGEDTSGYFGDEYPRIARRAIVVTAGFGFLRGAIVDQHFIKRERNNRLLSAILERPTLIGVGIDEGTALRVDPDGRWGVEGASAAVVYDARSATITPAGPSRLGAVGLQLHILPAGSTFDPRTGIASLPRR